MSPSSVELSGGVCHVTSRGDGRDDIYLGSEAFVRKMQAQIEQKPALGEIPRTQRRAITQPLPEFEQRYPRDEGMARAYLSGQHAMAAIARHLERHTPHLALSGVRCRQKRF